MSENRPTLTESRQRITRLVARLRSLGCKVSPVVGHDPLGGRYVYSITPPKGMRASVIGARHDVAPMGVRATIAPYQQGGNWVIVTCSPRDAYQRRQATALATVCALVEVAKRIDAYDTESSASVQHYIEVGEYLLKGEADE